MNDLRAGIASGRVAPKTSYERVLGQVRAFLATPPDSRYTRFIHMQRSGVFTWELAVPNGTYDVHLVAGDASFTDSYHVIDLEGQIALLGAPTTSAPWIESIVRVTVTDDTCGVGGLSGQVVGPGTNAGTFFAFAPEGDGTSWVGTFRLSPQAPRGIWRIQSITVNDKGQNLRIYYASDPLLARGQFVVK